MTAWHPYPDQVFTSNQYMAPSVSVSPDVDDKSPGKAKAWSKEGPVKNACLNCRNKKAKCDGEQPVCSQCVKKHLECVYIKSKRGGARKKRGAAAPSALQEYLKKLDGLLGLPDFSSTLSPGTSEPSDDVSDVVRQFASRDEIFRCYYNEVHPFLHLMPTRSHLDRILPTLLPESPFLLAVQTVLVLSSNSRDPNPTSCNSKRIRSAASHALGQQTMAAIERTLELDQSSSIECVQALCILGLWEWANAGNLTSSRSRSGQAIQIAMDLGLHEIDKHDAPDGRAVEGDDWRLDMARRTWWVVYHAQLTAALVSGTTPVVSTDDPRIRVHYPVCSIDDHSWPNWVEAVRQCMRVFAIVNTVYYSDLQNVTVWGTRHNGASADARAEMKRQMLEMDRQILDMMLVAEKAATIEVVPGGEEEVCHNQTIAARLALATTHIHIHRQQAFPEVSLFSKKICGLPQAPDFSAMSMLDSVAVPQALADGDVPLYHQSIEDQALKEPIGTGCGELVVSMEQAQRHSSFASEMWQPDTYPDDLPAPWFTHVGGAASFWSPVESTPIHVPALASSICPIDTSPPRGRVSSIASTTSIKPHKAWGVDANDKPEVKADADLKTIFPPGISLARCATAAHTIVRLEVLHRSAMMALSDGPPKWMPFCACGLVSGAYAFLLLALAVQAENTFDDSDSRAEVEGLLTNVKVILAGLERYGSMWSGIDVMAGEVRAALEAATRLPYEVRAQIERTASPPEDVNQHERLH